MTASSLSSAASDRFHVARKCSSHVSNKKAAAPSSPSWCPPHFYPSSTPSTVLDETHSMSSAPPSARSPGHRHTSSADSAKFEDTLPRSREYISSETFEGDDVYFARYPNNWAKIRSATVQLALDADSYGPSADLPFVAKPYANLPLKCLELCF